MNSERASTIGWREWVTLPAFSDTQIKAKVDTGAKTSSLHAEELRVIEHGDQVLAQFEFYPDHDMVGDMVGGGDQNVTLLTAPVIDFRTIRSSNGLTEVRPVIRTELEIGDRQLEVDLTLTCRSSMGHRMLLGRRFLENNYQVDPGRSFLLSTNHLMEEQSLRGEMV